MEDVFKTFWFSMIRPMEATSSQMRLDKYVWTHFGSVFKFRSADHVDICPLKAGKTLALLLFFQGHSWPSKIRPGGLLAI